VEPAGKRYATNYFTVVTTPEEADFALCLIESPISVGYDPKDREQGGNGYVPITLQYRPYEAKNARKVSIAGGDPLENFTNRSYKGKKNTAANEEDLDLVIRTKEQMGEKPVVVSISLKNPMVMAEVEPYADALLVDYGVQPEAVLDVVTGKFNPIGLLPIQLPMDMETVENQDEDVAFDMECYEDSEGHCYDFGYGMNFEGVISDERTRRYKR
ncbi:MAG: glycoside hydrolase family 3 C-terminal domain-containing protein, partial [Clostridiales bacterium]|nr:glycoside hydrolase family 3 C-terminal domain-containing protein [Clostridiales bacterium]